MASRKQIAAARRNIKKAQAANRTGPARRRGESMSATQLRRTRARISTREYRLPIQASASRANYAYPRGIGPDAGKRASYPITPKSRARAARTYASRKDTAGSLRHVDAAIRGRYGTVSAIYPSRSRRH